MITQSKSLPLCIPQRPVILVKKPFYTKESSASHISQTLHHTQPFRREENLLHTNNLSLANITVLTSQWERVQWPQEQLRRGVLKCQRCPGPSFQCLWIKHT